MFCKECGTEQKTGEKFCCKCGTQFLVLDTTLLSNTKNRSDHVGVSTDETKEQQLANGPSEIFENATSNIKNFHDGGQTIIESTMTLCEFKKLLFEIFKYNYDDAKDVYTVRGEEGVYWIDFSTVFNTRLIICRTHHVDNKFQLVFGYGDKSKLWGHIRFIAIFFIIYLFITANFIVLIIFGLIWGFFSSSFWNKFARNRCEQYIRDIDYAIKMKS